MTIKPGTYKLERDVENPSADRRVKRNWTALPTWRAGCEFLVVLHERDLDASLLAELPEEVREKARTSMHYVTIHLVGHRWSHHAIGPGHDEQYAALVAALVPVEESNEAMFTRLGVDGHFSQWLVTGGKISRELFEEWWNQYQNQPEEP